MDTEYKVNNLKRDEYGRPSGVLAIKKPTGVSSHDVVDDVRHILKMRKVGHAGALDVFASGVLIVLVGKATKLSEQMIVSNKEYKATVLVGLATDTQDPEGKIIASSSTVELEKLNDKYIADTLKSFIGEQMQYVSVYSSVKVNGNKLRKVMRDERYSPKVYFDDNNRKHIAFNAKTNNVQSFDIEVPEKLINIYDLKLDNVGEVKSSKLDARLQDQVTKEFPKLYKYLEITVACSKGSYIRQLAEDIGRKMGLSAMLISLERTRVSNYTIDDLLTVDEFREKELNI